MTCLKETFFLKIVMIMPPLINSMKNTFFYQIKLYNMNPHFMHLLVL